MKPTFIKYGKRKIRIQYVILKDCFGLYDPNTQILEIDIIGDPYLLGIPGNVSTESEQLRDINTESNIFVLFINYFPDNSEENFYNKGPIDLYTSGVYEVRTIDHRFTQGQFKSKLKMFRDHGTNVYMLKNRLEDR